MNRLVRWPFRFSKIQILIFLALGITLFLTPLPERFLKIPVLKAQDFFFTLRYHVTAPPKLLSQILLVSIDEKSIAALNERWPLSRAHYADLLERLMPAAPKVIAFDFVFSGRGDPLGDFRLAQAIERTHNVVLASFVGPDGSVIISEEEIRSVAAGSGVVNKILDSDLTVRRAKLKYQDEHGNLAALPWEIEILRQFQSVSLSFPRKRESRNWVTRSSRVMTEERINFRLKPADVDQISFHEFLTKGVEASRVKDKIIVIGTTASALHDYYGTPLGFMPGVVINLNFLANLISGDHLRELPKLFEILAGLALLAFGLFFALRFDALRGAVYLGISSATFLAIFFLLFLFNYPGDFFTPLVGSWAGFACIALYRSFRMRIENATLKGKVETDPLTSLYNRRALEDRLPAELEKLTLTKGERRGDISSELSVMMIDIDDFKKLNDTFGHPFGDDVLRSVAFLIRQNIRSDDIAVRYGGEEFCIVLPSTQKEIAFQIAEKIRRAVCTSKHTYVNLAASLSVSVGIASARKDELFAMASLIRAADEALYQAKHQGKNQTVLFSGFRN